MIRSSTDARCRSTSSSSAGTSPGTARRAPTAIASLTKLYLTDRRDGEAAGPFFSREFERAGSMIAPYEELDAASARPEDFIEPGACEEFRPATQAGECAA